MTRKILTQFILRFDWENEGFSPAKVCELFYLNLSGRLLVKNKTILMKKLSYCKVNCLAFFFVIESKQRDNLKWLSKIITRHISLLIYLICRN